MLALKTMHCVSSNWSLRCKTKYMSWLQPNNGGSMVRDHAKVQMAQVWHCIYIGQWHMSLSGFDMKPKITQFFCMRICMNLGWVQQARKFVPKSELLRIPVRSPNTQDSQNRIDTAHFFLYDFSMEHYARLTINAPHIMRLVFLGAHAHSRSPPWPGFEPSFSWFGA